MEQERGKKLIVQEWAQEIEDVMNYLGIAFEVVVFEE